MATVHRSSKSCPDWQIEDKLLLHVCRTVVGCKVDMIYVPALSKKAKLETAHR